MAREIGIKLIGVRKKAHRVRAGCIFFATSNQNWFTVAPPELTFHCNLQA